jgi:thioredoxin-like negative regulator of GroEL
MPPSRLHVQLYSRPGCHLGNDLRAICERLASELPFQLTEVNVDEDPRLAEQYGRAVPVLLLDGRPVVRYRTSERELRQILQWQLWRRRFRRGSAAGATRGDQ